MNPSQKAARAARAAANRGATGRAEPAEEQKSLREYDRSPETIESDKALRTPQWRRLKEMLLAGYPKCWLCECSGVKAPADSLDHVIPRTERPDLVYSVQNLRPCHHNRCAVCGCRCNTIRGMGSPERARRIIEARKAKANLVVQVAEEKQPEGREL